jgi:hypothetical protein
LRTPELCSPRAGGNHDARPSPFGSV